MGALVLSLLEMKDVNMLGHQDYVLGLLPSVEANISLEANRFLKVSAAPS